MADAIAWTFPNLAELWEAASSNRPDNAIDQVAELNNQDQINSGSTPVALWHPSGLPLLNPPPPNDAQVWECEVAIVGGSLGGIAAAYHAMQSGAVTCLIELTPMLGGQISSQGVSAIDESLTMRDRQNFSTSWKHLKELIASQDALPDRFPHQKFKNLAGEANQNLKVADLNSCWVGDLCFLPTAGAKAAEALLNEAAANSPQSRWGTQIAFKGASFNQAGNAIETLYAVQRIPRDANYVSMGRLSREITSWYSWSEDQVFKKQPIRLQPPPGKQMLVIDATDTGELIGWANLPYRLGSESPETTGEVNAIADNPECTQAFTFPFILAIADDAGESLQKLKQVKPGITKAEHRRDYSLGSHPMFSGQSFFNYRRALSINNDNPFTATPRSSDMTIVNWNNGNDWGIMNPALIMTSAEIEAAGQHHNWLGGLNLQALKQAENHALLFSEWLIENYASAELPLQHLSGLGMPIPTDSGLSFYPYIREGRRILGRSAYGEADFMLKEQDIRVDMNGRDFTSSVIGITHYAIDIHGCRYRNWQPSRSASSAPATENWVKPIYIPLESLIPAKIG
jgi:hypothetical protein